MVGGSTVADKPKRLQKNLSCLLLAASAQAGKPVIMGLAHGEKITGQIARSFFFSSLLKPWVSAKQRNAAQGRRGRYDKDKSPAPLRSAWPGCPGPP